MTAKPITALILTLVPIGHAIAVQPPWGYRNVTHPPCADGIPLSRYQYGGRSASAVEVSKTGIMLRRGTRVGEAIAPPPQVVVRSEYNDRSVRQPAGIGGIHLDRSIDSYTAVVPTPPPPRQSVIDLYQLDRAGIQIDHCEISDVAIQLHDNGQWVLSLRADQNRRPEDGGPEGFNPFLHIRRNEFFIRLRCLGAYDHPPITVVQTTGKPVLVDLDPCAFWVENGQPRYIRHHGFDPLVAEHFGDIDRVEIEFFYR